MRTFLQKIGCFYRENVPLAQYTTFRIGGNAEFMVFPKNEAQALEVLRHTKRNSIPCHIIGHGSNLLIADNGVQGVVLSTRKIQNIQIFQNRIKAGAGVPLGGLLALCQRQGFSGMENLVGIPASVGGAVAMNAGANGTEICQLIENIVFYDTLTDTVKELSPKQFAFSYRHSLCREREGLILSVTFSFYAGNTDTIGTKMKEIAAWRKQKQPLMYPSAGSVFLRPFPNHAPLLIEMAGLKGKKVGGACVSSKHSGFIVNRENAQAFEVKQLIAYIQNEVWKRFSVSLIPEIIFWGNERL